MSEFKIKVSVELDSSDLESKLKALGKEQEIELKLNTDKIESQLNSLKKSFKDTFKLDGQVINDLNKISKKFFMNLYPLTTSDKISSLSSWSIISVSHVEFSLAKSKAFSIGTHPLPNETKTGFPFSIKKSFK